MPTHRLSFPSAREHPLDPPLVQTELRESCPVVAVELHDGQPAWLVTRYDDIRTVLSDDRFSSAELWRFAGSANRAAAERAETSFTVMDPPDHTHYRRLFTRYFTIKRVETLRPRIQAIVDEAVDALLAAPGRADLVHDLALPIASQTMCALVGCPTPTTSGTRSGPRCAAGWTATPRRRSRPSRTCWRTCPGSSTGRTAPRATTSSRPRSATCLSPASSTRPTSSRRCGSC